MSNEHFEALDLDSLDAVSGGLSVRNLGVQPGGGADPFHPLAGVGTGGGIPGTVSAGAAPLGIGVLDGLHPVGAPTGVNLAPVGGALNLLAPPPAGNNFLQPQLGGIAPQAQPQPNIGGILNAVPGVINGLQGGNPLGAIGPIGNLIGAATGNPQIGRIAGAIPGVINGLQSGNPLGAIGSIGNLVGAATGNPQIGQIAGAVQPLLNSFLGGGGGGGAGNPLGGLGNLFGGGGGGQPPGGGGLGDMFGGGGDMFGGGGDFFGGGGGLF